MASEAVGLSSLPAAADAQACEVGASPSAAPLSADHLCLVPEGECESEGGCETPGEDAEEDAGPDAIDNSDDGKSGHEQHSEAGDVFPTDAGAPDTGRIGQNVLTLPMPEANPARPSVSFNAPTASASTQKAGARSSGTTIFARGSQVARPSLPGLFKSNPKGKSGPLTEMQQEAESDAQRPSTHSISMAIDEEEGSERMQRARVNSDGSLSDTGKLQTKALSSDSGSDARNSPRFSMDSGAKPSFNIGNQNAGRRFQAGSGSKDHAATLPDIISKSLLAARDNLADHHEDVIKLVSERLTNMSKEACTLQAENRGLRIEVGKLSKQIEALRISEQANVGENSHSPFRISASVDITENSTHASDLSRQPRGQYLHPRSGPPKQPEARESFQETGIMPDNSSNDGKKVQWSNILSSVPSFVAGKQSQQLQITPLESQPYNHPDAKTTQIDSSEEVRSLRMEKFEVLPAWKERAREDEPHRATVHCKSRQKRQRKVHSLNFTDCMVDTEEEEPKARSVIEKVIISPNSPKRVYWDTMSLALVVYDMIAIPLQLFDPPETTFSLILAWLSRLFWTSDIGMTFFTGILKEDGTVEMRVKMIARRYILTWFTIDISIVVSDWSELLWMGQSRFGYERIGKASRTFRIVRMIRLLRLIRMRQVVRLITERIRSERLTIVADMIKIVLIICGLAHLIACVWYGIGDADNATYDSWVEKFGLSTENLGYRYTTSLHWSLSQFAGGMDEVKPYNLNERIFAIFVFLFAFCTATVFVSSLTSSMTRLHIIGGQRQQKLSILRRYLAENNISSRLAIRVARNAQHVLHEQERSIPEANVELIMCVSEALRVELHFEMFSPVYATHLFFMRYTEECPQVMCRVCHCATSMVSLSSMDTVFNAGEIPASPKMYFLRDGAMQYVSITGHVSSLPDPTYVSEGALWTSWMHLGTLTATRESRICVVDSLSFQEIVNQFDHPDFDPRTYAAEFVRDLNANEPSDLPSVSMPNDWSPGREAGARSNSGSLHMKGGFSSFLPTYMPRKFRPSVDAGTCYSQPLGGNSKAFGDKN